MFNQVPKFSLRPSYRDLNPPHAPRCLGRQRSGDESRGSERSGVKTQNGEVVAQVGRTEKKTKFRRSCADVWECILYCTCRDIM